MTFGSQTAQVEINHHFQEPFAYGWEAKRSSQNDLFPDPNVVCSHPRLQDCDPGNACSKKLPGSGILQPRPLGPTDLVDYLSFQYQFNINMDGYE